MTRSIALAVPFGIMVSALVSSPSLAADDAKKVFSAAPPSGFEQLEGDRELVLDVYYGGIKRGTARVALFGDRVQFMDPRQVFSFIDDARPGSPIPSYLQRPLAANQQLACGLSVPEGCGQLSTEGVGVVLDEDRFRIDLFIAPSLHVKESDLGEKFLAPPPKAPSLLSLFGAALSGGTGGGEMQYRLQNRTIVAFGRSRLKSDLSIEHERGLSFDNFVAESDRGDWRFSAGEFWVPGSDLISRRKIIGAGVSSQHDTRRNRELFYGTPVDLFLASPARVEVFVNGSLVASQVLSAGNRQLDTSSWPSGSYDAVIRVYEQGQAVREERRFFSRDEALAPLGHPSFQLFGGVYSNGSNFRDATSFIQGAVAYRFSQKIGVRAMAIAVHDKVIGDLSSTVVTPWANFTAGMLASSKGDTGLVIRGYTTSIKGVSASFDLRRMHTSGNGPLLPESDRAGTFDQGVGASFDRGDFLQLTGQLSARIQQATLRFSSYFRRSPSSANSYSFGPSLDVSIVRNSRFSIVGEANAQKTDAGFSSYAGIRLLLTQGPRGLAARGGIETGNDHPPRLRGEVQGSVYGENGSTYWSANAAIGKTDFSTYARGGGELRSNVVDARGELLKDFGGETQYSLTAQTGLVLGGGSVAVAGGEIRDSALVVTVDGDETDVLDILVNHSRVGSARTGHPLTVYMEPYREYEVQARPHGADLLTADLTPRKIATYPGSVVRSTWEVSRLFVAFGRLLDGAGAPIRNAQISGSHGLAQSDEDGYFQIETGGEEQLAVSFGDQACALVSPTRLEGKDYLKWGDVRCR